MPRTDAADAFRRAAVKIFTVIKRPNYYQPWDLGYQSNSGGSGCVIEGRRILTNAHVVADQVFVEVLKPGETTKFTASVEHVDHECELAVLRVNDPAFFRGTVPVRLGQLLERRKKVAVCGFPVGGNDLSITEGVVSRVEVVTYTHSQRELLAMQTDAAINPGNSGGPVIHEGRLVGIAFQSYSGSGAENTGYAVPVPIIRRFLKEVESGGCRGVPHLGIHWQKMESASLRASLGMRADQTGILVTKVVHGSSADGVLAENDVVTAISGSRLANDGSARLSASDRVNFTHLVSQERVGDVLALSILRGGRKHEVSVTLGPIKELVPGPRYDVRPTYLLFAGLVFMPLTHNFLRVWEWNDVEPRFKYLHSHGLPSPRRKGIVFINQVLAHPVNVGYHNLRSAIVERVNGARIREMADVTTALKRPRGGYQVIELDHHPILGGADYDRAFGNRLVLDAEAAQASTAEILARYGIARDRSRDMPD